MAQFGSRGGMDDEHGDAAGFDSRAYQWNGETIIAYRGTDDGSCFTPLPE